MNNMGMYSDKNPQNGPEQNHQKYYEKYPMLFSPGKIGNVQLDNRIIMTVMHTGLSMKKETDFLVERVKHGACLVTACMGVESDGANDDMHIIGEDTRAEIKELVDRIHDAGGRLAIQMYHAGRNVYYHRRANKDGMPVAPSPVPSVICQTMPEELTKERIERLYEIYREKALLLRECGVDVLEISASAGYLLSEFFSTNTNLREDEFGGSLENRIRFPLEVVKNVREAVGNEQAVIIRIAGSDMMGGYSLADMQYFAKAAEPYLDGFNVTGGWHEAGMPQISYQLPEGGFAFLAEAIKNVVKVPVIACNRINSPEVAEEVLEEGMTDFCGLARAFLIEPDFVERVKEDRPYKKCIGCNQGCIERILRCIPPTCVFNPVPGYEEEFAALVGNGKAQNEKTPKKLLIVGAGPAGLSAARFKALAGFDVTVVEKENRAGGNLNFAALAPYKQTIAWNINAMAAQAEEAGAKILYGVNADSAYIEEFKADEVIIAAGTTEIIPPIPGIDGKNVYTLKQVYELTEQEKNAITAGPAVIIGGGASGLELAQSLLESKKLLRKSRDYLDLFNLPGLEKQFMVQGRMTVIDQLPKLGKDLGGKRWILMKELRRYPVNLMPASRALKIEKGYVEVEQTILPKRGASDAADAEPEKRIVKIPANNVIVAAGYRPEISELTEALDSKGIRYTVIGDSCTDHEQSIQKACEDALRTMM